MADNRDLAALSGNAACDEVTYSGDTAVVQLARLVHVSGTEGAKTVTEIVGTAGSPGTAVLTVQGVASGTAQPVSDGGGSLTVDGTVAVSAISSALPAGTNAIGKLAANSGVDIGDVDVASVVPGTGATNLGKAVDSAAGSTDTGIAILAIRDDALSTLTPVEGDYVPLRVSSTGALHITGTLSTSAATASTATLANVAASATSVTLQALNASRLKVVIVNDSTVNLYVKYGSTASTSSYTYLLQAGETLTESLYTGIITGIWASATGNARVTELTA